MSTYGRNNKQFYQIVALIENPDTRESWMFPTNTFMEKKFTSTGKMYFKAVPGEDQYKIETLDGYFYDGYPIEFTNTRAFNTATKHIEYTQQVFPRLVDPETFEPEQVVIEKAVRGIAWGRTFILNLFLFPITVFTTILILRLLNGGTL